MANLNGTGSADIEGVQPTVVVNNTSVFKFFKEKLLVPLYRYLKDTACHYLIEVLVIPIGRIWNNIVRVLFWEEVVLVMPRSTLTFMVTALLSFVEIKSQGRAGFPFQTHPYATMVSVTGLVVYGFASLAELLVAPAGFHRPSVYAIIARLGRVASLSVLVVSLAYLFY